tara:strand:+ start:778 stop:1179 length:402 start_codon:yes stop_codon:yes gene_type:complete
MIKVKSLYKIIDNNVIDDDAEIVFTSVRTGINYAGYEMWKDEDHLGRSTIHISIATEGDSDHERIEADRMQEPYKDCIRCDGSGTIWVKPNVESTEEEEHDCPICDNKGQVSKMDEILHADKLTVITFDEDTE